MLYLIRNGSPPQLSQIKHGTESRDVSWVRVYFKNCDFLINPHFWISIAPPDVEGESVESLRIIQQPTAAQLKVIGSSWAFIYGMVEQIHYAVQIHEVLRSLSCL